MLKYVGTHTVTNHAFLRLHMTQEFLKTEMWQKEHTYEFNMGDIINTLV